MPRYFSAPKAKVKSECWWYDEPIRHDVTVCDHEATDTGLIDANGDRIMRAPNPVGFVWSDE